MSPNRATFPLRLALTLLGCTACLPALATEAGVDNIGPGTDGFFMLPLGVSAVTLGFGFLITLDEPPLDLRDSPLLVPMAQALASTPRRARSPPPSSSRCATSAAPGRDSARV